MTSLDISANNSVIVLIIILIIIVTLILISMTTQYQLYILTVYDSQQGCLNYNEFKIVPILKFPYIINIIVSNIRIAIWMKL